MSQVSAESLGHAQPGEGPWLHTGGNSRETHRVKVDLFREMQTPSAGVSEGLRRRTFHRQSVDRPERRETASEHGAV